MTRTEAVGVFDDASSLQDAIDELLSSGFNQAEISLLASEHAVEEKLGHIYESVSELEDNPLVPRRACFSARASKDAKFALTGELVYVGGVVAAGAVVASGGTLATAIIAATIGAGAGGPIGDALGGLFVEQDSRYFQEQLDHGGLLLWVEIVDKEHKQRATRILSKYSARDVHTHALPSESS